MKPRFLALALVLVLATPAALARTLYWDGAGTWTAANNWSLVPGTPFDQTWAAGDDAVFDVAGTITGASAIFSSITANQSVTLTAGGVLSPLFTADITVATGKTFSLGGQNNNTGQVLGGAGGIRKRGDGELVIGNATNTYTGGFTMDAGTVSVWNANALGQGGALELNGGTLRSLGGDQNMSGKFSDITIGGNFGLGGNGGGFTFDAPTILGDATRTITVGNIHTFNGPISSDPGGGIAKEGTGTLVLGGDNNFTGPVIINDGYLNPTHNNALGSTVGATTINGGGGPPAADFEFLTPTLTFFRASTGLTVAENLNFRANGAGLCTLLNTNSGIDQLPRDHTLTGIIDVTSEQNSVNFTSEGTGSFTFTGNITGTMTFGSNLQLRGSSSNISNRVLGSLNLSGGDLVKTGSGFWLVGAAGAGKTYHWNNTRMANGTLKLGLANILPPSGLLIMGNTRAGTFGGSDGVLELNGFDQTVAGIIYVGNTGASTTTGTRRITSTTAAVLTVNSDLDFSPTGGSPGTSVILQGALGLKKEGVGKLTLSGANSNTGPTTVSAGTLALVGGSQASPITVNAAALGFTLGFPTTSTNTVTFLAGATVTITGTPDLGTNYTLLTTSATISGPLVLEPPISGFQLQVQGSNTLKLVSTFATWASAKGLTGAAGFENGPTDDPDNDGRSNLQEFAFDGNPLSAANDGKLVGKVAAVSGNPFLTLTLPVRTGAIFMENSGDQLAGPIDGIYYRIEGSTDLVIFADTITEVTIPDQTPIQAGLPPLSSTDWAYRTFRVSGTVPAVPKNFLRAVTSGAF